MSQNLAWVTRPNAGRIIQFKVNISVNLFDAFHEFINENDLHYGIVIGSCGALKRAVFSNVKEVPKSYPIEKSNLISFECERPMETTSLTGWFYHDEDQELIHLHCSAVCNENDIPKVYGGHLVDAVAGPKMVITVLELVDDSLFVGFDDQCKKIDLVLRK